MLNVKMNLHRVFKMLEESINKMKGKNNNYGKDKNGTCRAENTAQGKVVFKGRVNNNNNKNLAIETKMLHREE